VEGTAGDTFDADDLVPPLVACCFFDAFAAGVWGFLVERLTSSPVGSAPVIVSSAASKSSGVLSSNTLLLGRMDLDFVTKPSLSSLKLCAASLTILVCVTVLFVGCLRGAVFATRDVTLVLGGRGIVACNCRKYPNWCV
jgi:hypothetical protein